jgi:hypothetical protein
VENSAQLRLVPPRELNVNMLLLIGTLNDRGNTEHQPQKLPNIDTGLSLGVDSLGTD